MTTQLPAHLQGRQTRKLTEFATAGLGGGLPPHISIAGNCFTLIDAAGNIANPIGPGQPPMQVLSAVIFDISGPHNNKRYYENDYAPGSDEPPTCWSANGLTPSRDAITPQSVLCADCQWNVRGSDVSKLSGKAIKACRDERWMAVYLPQFANMLFQLLLTPGSFKNWKAFTEPFKGQDTDISDVVVNIAFEAGKNGVLTFGATAYIDAATADLRDKAAASKATDILVGRNDQPRALPGPASQAQITNGSQPAPFVPGTAPNAGFPQTQTAPQQLPGQPAPGASPSDQLPAGQGAPPARRPRRTAAQMALANAGAQQAPVGQTEMRSAPFPNAGPVPGQMPPAGAPAGPAFGIGQGMPPNPEVQAALAGIFKTQ